MWANPELMVNNAFTALKSIKKKVRRGGGGGWGWGVGWRGVEEEGWSTYCMGGIGRRDTMRCWKV
jgi:hypothetical protein